MIDKEGNRWLTKKEIDDWQRRKLMIDKEGNRWLTQKEIDDWIEMIMEDDREIVT